MQPPAIPADPASDAAGFWPRAVAWLIDAALIAVPVGVATGLLGDGRGDALASQWRGLGVTMGEAMMAAAVRGDAPLAMLQSWAAADGPLRRAITDFVASLYAAAWPVVALFALLALLVWPLQEAGRHHATLGKRALGLRVETVACAPPGPARAYRRHVAGSLSWLTLNIGHLLAATAPRHQALHDRIARTYVVWHPGVDRRVPMWGWWLLAIACVLPLVLAVMAAGAMSAAMQAALGM